MTSTLIESFSTEDGCMCKVFIRADAILLFGEHNDRPGKTFVVFANAGASMSAVLDDPISVFAKKYHDSMGVGFCNVLFSA